jgi:hypothetical protein
MNRKKRQIPVNLAQLVGTSHYICMSRGSNLRQSLIYLKIRISSHYDTKKENVNLTEKKNVENWYVEFQNAQTYLTSDIITYRY